MSQLLKKSASSHKKLTKSEAEELVRLFPLTRLSENVYDALQENHNKRVMQNIFVISQLHILRGAYNLLQSQVSGFQMAFPVKIEKDGDRTTIVWVGECDTFGLNDFNAFKAVTKWKENKDAGHILVENQVYLIGWTSCSCGNDEIKIIINHVSPSIFNDVFRALFKALGTFEACPSRKFLSDDDDYLGRHPKNCNFCHNEGQVSTYRIITEFNPQFNPAVWFSITTDFFDYGK